MRPTVSARPANPCRPGGHPRRRLAAGFRQPPLTSSAVPSGPATGSLATGGPGAGGPFFATCYMNRNEPGIGEDFAAVFIHNDIPVRLAEKERCCGMPKMELGDLESVRA